MATRAEQPPAECRLDASGLDSQRERYAALGRHVSEAQRSARRLRVVFDASVDAALLHETVAIERRCCAFFRIEVQGLALVVTVEDAVRDPALDAIAAALGVGAQSAQRSADSLAGSA